MSHSIRYVVSVAARLLFVAVLGCALVSPATGAEASTATPTFKLDVMAVLSRAGCNMGACHGNQNGKGGFKLSLRGQDPSADHRWLTRQFAGRRINRMHPEQSLLLLKPTGTLAHQGGVRFRRDSAEYRTLLTWISQGAVGPRQGTPQVTSLTVQPRRRVVSDNSKEIRLRATVKLSDGSQRDVTEQAVYETSNLIVKASPNGVVTRNQYGESTIIVRYLQHQVAVPVAFLKPRPQFRWAQPPTNNQVDRFVFAKLRRLQINPSSLSQDGVFIRRLYLDVLGVLPTRREALAFQLSRDPDKRRRLIDHVLARPEFADHWALKWSDLLRNEEKVLDTQGVKVFYRWIHDQIERGAPLNEFVRQLVIAEGSTYKEPPANFYRANRNPSIRAETVARLFLGVRLQCAKCHNHPFDRWTQDDYYSWAAFFARIKYKIVKNKRRDKFDKNEFVGEQLVQVPNQGEVKNARTGKVARPKLLGARLPKIKKGEDRRLSMARWLTSRSNRMFARSQVNFVWYHVMRRGLVEPIDDFRVTNPPSHPGLMSYLADEFVRHKFDLRYLVKKIVSSRTYQLSSVPNDTNRLDQQNYSRAIVQRLTAEQLLDGQAMVLGTPTPFVGYPTGLRAGQIPGVRKIRRRSRKPTEGDRFLATFGKPERLLACECERSNETTLKQVFVLLGGDGLHARLQRSWRLRQLSASSLPWDEVIKRLYWHALTRSPTDKEIAAARALVTAAKSNQKKHRQQRFEALADLTWALLNAKEFIFRH